ncbi:hypothetical protein FKM82_008385 [Ascaphus truei]
MWRACCKDSTPFVSTDCFAPHYFLCADKTTLLVIYAENTSQLTVYSFPGGELHSVLHHERVSCAAGRNPTLWRVRGTELL